jgi:glycosyltransferase involved in cell wall biosynthesis
MRIAWSIPAVRDVIGSAYDQASAMTAHLPPPQPTRRLCVYCDATEIGGAEVSLSHLIAGLGPETEVRILGTDPHVLEFLAGARPGAETTLLPTITARSDLAALRAHHAAIRRCRPCILHVSLNRPWGSQWAIISGLLSGGVKVVAVNKLPRPATCRKHRLYMRAVGPRIDAHVTLGERMAQLVADLYEIPRHGIRTIPSGVPAAEVKPIPRPSGVGPVVGTVGRATGQKGFDVLLEAIAQVPEAQLVVVGGGPDLEDLVARAKTLGIGERVEFTGWVDNPRDHLTRFDLYVQPSRFEAQGLAIAEAMLAELAVVATDVGGIPDVVIDGETGLLVPPEDPEALARAIAELIDDPARRAEMGRAGRRRAAEKFTAAGMVAGFERLYRELEA